jgi:hypothetical protein
MQTDRNQRTWQQIENYTLPFNNTSWFYESLIICVMLSGIWDNLKKKLRDEPPNQQ